MRGKCIYSLWNGPNQVNFVRKWFKRHAGVNFFKCFLLVNSYLGKVFSRIYSIWNVPSLGFFVGNWVKRFAVVNYFHCFLLFLNSSLSRNCLYLHL